MYINTPGIKDYAGLNKMDPSNISTRICCNYVGSEIGTLIITTQTELFVCWLLNVPATCECISGTDLLRQFYVLPH